jgi:xanthine dehydrogenase accessory factor
MESLVTPLLPLFEREREAGRAMALAVVLRTAGSTYSKAGALLLIAADGEYAGLLSGGCLEGDLRDRAQSVIDTGKPVSVSYDTRGPEDLLWGLGAGCEGAMDIFLLRVCADNGWQPLQHLREALRAHVSTAVGLVVEATDPAMATGAVLLPAALPALEQLTRDGESAWLSDTQDRRVFGLTLALPPRILLLGAGPDTLPVFDFAMKLGWKVTLYDHRSAYTEAERFPGAERVVEARPEQLAGKLDLSRYDAAVVMSHHLQSDLAYLRALAASPIGYVGLLGPAPRREKLRSELGAQAETFAGRLRSPVGLAIGGRSSASIALAIVAEIHAWLHGRAGGPFSGAGTVGAAPLPRSLSTV